MNPTDSPIWRPWTQMKTTPPPLKVVKGEGVWLELERTANFRLHLKLVSDDSRAWAPRVSRGALSPDSAR